MSGKKPKNEIPTDEAIVNLLLIGLLRDGIDPTVLEEATGIPEKTIRNRFPMKKVKGQ